jgi:hypothetical protein
MAKLKFKRLYLPNGNFHGEGLAILEDGTLVRTLSSNKPGAAAGNLMVRVFDVEIVDERKSPETK